MAVRSAQHARAAWVVAGTVTVVLGLSAALLAVSGPANVIPRASQPEAHGRSRAEAGAGVPATTADKGRTDMDKRAVLGLALGAALAAPAVFAGPGSDVDVVLKEIRAYQAEKAEAEKKVPCRDAVPGAGVYRWKGSAGGGAGGQPTVIIQEGQGR